MAEFSPKPFGSVSHSHDRGKPRITQEEAFATLRAANFEPLEPYPGFAKPWKNRCTQCGQESEPRYVNVKSGSRCRFCHLSRARRNRRTSGGSHKGAQAIAPMNVDDSKSKENR